MSFTEKGILMKHILMSHDDKKVIPSKPELVNEPKIKQTNKQDPQVPKIRMLQLPINNHMTIQSNGSTTPVSIQNSVSKSPVSIQNSVSPTPTSIQNSVSPTPISVQNNVSITPIPVQNNISTTPISMQTNGSTSPISLQSNALTGNFVPVQKVYNGEF